ncbi:hypothetical protein ASZ90_016523 [hydrocarbon metagenome]|uniref:Uncharacterized protein n=1 Tax=hydrocarbon metagenome TaxID=938273 RepID=A0A0W8ER08_9ZZZZ
MGSGKIARIPEIIPEICRITGRSPGSRDNNRENRVIHARRMSQATRDKDPHE